MEEQQAAAPANSLENKTGPTPRTESEAHLTGSLGDFYAVKFETHPNKHMVYNLPI